MRQCTIKKEIAITGVGLHTGKTSTLVLKPSAANSGINFILNGTRVPALYNYVNSTALSTNINVGNTVVNTIEHLMAALSALSVDNVDVFIDGDEIPIMNGSSDIFVDKINDCGLASQNTEKTFIEVNKSFVLHEGNKSIEVYPSERLIIEMTVDFNHVSIGKQQFVYEHSLYNFTNELSTAKTFCLESDINKMRAAGLIKGGTVDNAIIFGDSGSLNGIRFVDEPVRHKILDMIGDLYTMGNHIRGRFVVKSTGHSFTNKFIRKFVDSNAWGYNS